MSNTSSLILLIALLGTPLHAQATCGTPAFQLPDGGGHRQVRRFSGALVFESGLRVNTDGAANSYHPLGTKDGGALNTICNGIAVTPSTGPWKGQRITAKAPEFIPSKERCQTILDIFRASLAQGYAIPSTGTIDWYALATRPAADGKYRPCIQSSGPFAGFFVAQTSRAADPTKDICDPARWISSTQIPYVTLPGTRLKAHGVNPGDLALVHRRGQIVVAVAGDTGNRNELGEGSVALHQALGNVVGSGRIPGNISGGVTTFLFPGLKASRPITASSLEGQRAALLARLGGMGAVQGCVPS